MKKILSFLFLFVIFSSVAIAESEAEESVTPTSEFYMNASDGVSFALENVMAGDVIDLSVIIGNLEEDIDVDIVIEVQHEIGDWNNLDTAWFELPYTEFILGAELIESYFFSINLPDSLEPGTYRSNIIATGINSIESEAGGGGAAINVVTGVGLPIIIEVIDEEVIDEEVIDEEVVDEEVIDEEVVDEEVGINNKLAGFLDYIKDNFQTLLLILIVLLLLKNSQVEDKKKKKTRKK